MRVWRTLKAAALVVAVLALVAAALMLSREPAVPARGRPTAAELKAGEDAVRQLDAVQETGAGTIRLDSAALSGLAAIASRATGQERLRLDLHPDRVAAAGSHDLPLGLWLNFAVTALAEGPGVPPGPLEAKHMGHRRLQLDVISTRPTQVCCSCSVQSPQS